MALDLNDSRDEIDFAKSTLYHKVEDIMCDQRIISNDISAELESNTSYIILSAARIRGATAVLARTLVPTVLKVYYLYLRNQQFVVDNVRQRILPTIIAFLANSISASLASVQKHIPLPLSRPAIKNISDDLAPTVDDIADSTPESSVECCVLYTPSKDVQVDVIFIHGLHGGLCKTWKQGLWRHEGHKLKDQTPVRKNSTGNLYVPVKKQSLKRSLSDIYTTRKLARNDNEQCVTRTEGEWEVIDEVKGGEHEDECYSDCWPRDWIYKDCPDARVMALNYTTDILWCPVWKKKRNRTGIVERSDEMIDELIKLGVGKKPIIWVGHSKGGLFVKQILLNAFELHRDDPKIYSICKNTKGIMFYSVPHKGSALADLTLPLLRRSVELVEIQRNCRFILDMHKRFVQLCKEGHLTAEIFSFIETSFTFMTFVYLKIVAYDSAEADLGVKCDVPLDHREICKPAGRDCFLYLELIRVIRKYSLPKV